MQPVPQASPMISGFEAAAGRVRLTQRQIWVIFGGLMLGSFLGSLDQTVVTLPSMLRNLGTASQLSWVVTGYLLASIAATGEGHAAQPPRRAEPSG